MKSSEQTAENSTEGGWENEISMQKQGWTELLAILQLIAAGVLLQFEDKKCDSISGS